MTYTELVNYRKKYDVKITGFINQSQVAPIELDMGDHLEPWSKWQGKIPADILVVGQDWGSEDYYLKNNGKDDDVNPTCKNLISLFEEIGIKIGTPGEPKRDVNIHFTNIIPFLRTGKMQGSAEVKINNGVIKKCANEFLEPLIDIVKPKIIIALGAWPFLGVVSALKVDYDKKKKYRELVNASPFYSGDSILIFPMFHCGTLSINMNQPLAGQKKDWSKIKQHIDREKGNANQRLTKNETQGLTSLPDHLKTITRSDWQKLFSLIPQMEQGQHFGELKGGERITENMTTEFYWESSDVVGNFIKAAYDLGLVVDFDCGNWEEGKTILENNRQDYNELDITTLCKLITTIIRTDKFSDGYLVSCFQNGIVPKIILAMKNKVNQK